MAISALPTPPSRSSPSDFSAKADAFIAALPTFVTEANAVAAAMNLNATNATSTTSLAIGTGSKSLTVDTDKSYQPGMSVKIARTASPSNWMHGDVVSYNSGTGALVVNVTTIFGGGTYTDWTVTFSAPIQGIPWTQTVGTFTATPASTSTLTMTTDLTAILLVGTPLKYTIGGTTYYGVVSAIASNLLTVAGAPLSGDVTSLYYGDPTRVQQVNVIIPGLYENATDTTLIANDLGIPITWDKAKAYMVRYRVRSNIHDGGTHGQANVYINGSAVGTANTNAGLSIEADDTWYSSVVDINVSNYDINPGDVLEVGATKNGTGDAQDLGVQMTFVIP